MYHCIYYSAIKHNEMLPFAATWMDPEMTVLSEGRWEKQKSYNFYVKAKKKYDTNKLIYKIEMDSQT